MQFLDGITEYTSKEACKEKIKYAIMFCTAIYLDSVGHGGFEEEEE